MRIVLILSLVVTLLYTPHTALALGQGDYHLKFWGGGLNVWVSYPEDASPGDSVDVNIYIVSGKYPRGNHVEEVKAKISVLTSSNPAVLYDDTLIYDTYMNPWHDFNQTIPITLPSDARWFMSIQIDTASHQFDTTDREEAHVTLDATQIRASTYEESQNHVQELQEYISKMDQKYNELSLQLQTLQSTGGGDCTQLQSDYLDLVEDYITVTSQYNTLITENQTASNPDLEAAFQDLETMYLGLIEEHETTTTILSNTIDEQENQIESLAERADELELEKTELVDDKESLQAELEQLSGETVSHEEYGRLENNLRSANNQRNILVVVLVLSIAAAAILFNKTRS